MLCHLPHATRATQDTYAVCDVACHVTCPPPPAPFPKSRWLVYGARWLVYGAEGGSGVGMAPEGFFFEEGLGIAPEGFFEGVFVA
jgi:hypothetical protein